MASQAVQERISVAPTIDPQIFRETLGNFPTGVVAVTAMVDGSPVGMIVGSFTSVSLDPPLVAYLPSKDSSSYAQIRTADRFCINVLSVEQDDLCRTFAMKGATDKFAHVDWTLSELGSPRLAGAVAWIECTVENTLEGGDHDIVVGRVEALEPSHSGSPLLFFQGGYGGFRPRPLIAPFADALSQPLQVADLARPYMEALSEELGVNCFAQAIVDREIMIVAATDSSARIQIGRRMPFAPPFGAAFLAGGDLDARVREWTAHLRVTDEQRLVYREKLETIAERGWSYGLYTPRHEEIWAEIAAANAEPQTPALERKHASLLEELVPYYDPVDLPTENLHPRILTSPVLKDGFAPIVLALFGLPANVSPTELERYGQRLREATQEISALL